MENKLVSNNSVLNFRENGIFFDLMFIILWMMGALVVLNIPYLWLSPLRIVMAMPLILIFPGYALVAALFPKNDFLDGFERFSFSLGASIGLVPLLVFLINFTGLGIRFDPVFLLLMFVTTILTVIAYLRRLMAPENERFSIPVHGIFEWVRSLNSDSSGMLFRKVISILFVLSVLLVATTSALLIMSPEQTETDTEFFIQGGGEPGREYLLFQGPDETGDLTVGIVNHEKKPVVYTVEIYGAYIGEATTPHLKYMKRIDMFIVSLQHDQKGEVTWTLPENSRKYDELVFLLFKDDVPGDTIRDDERVSASYRDLFLRLEGK